MDMENNKSASIGSLLTALSENLSAADIVLAGLKAEISAVITAKRLELGFSQKEFADFMGVSQGLVSRWENGDTNFTLQTLSDIAVKLDIKTQSPFVTNKKHSYIGESRLIDMNTFKNWHTAASEKPSWRSPAIEDSALAAM